MAKESRLSAIEHTKAASRSLRGTIADELGSSQPGFSSDNAHLLKFHGVIQHDDRDVRQARRQQGLEKQFEFSVRVRPTGGRMTAEQMLGLMDLTDQLCLGPLRLTSRQGLQLTHLPKHHLREVIQRITSLGMTTFSSGGDVNCNVMCCPASYGDAQQELRALADEIAATLMPDAQAYDELWLSDVVPHKRAHVDVANVDAVYGESYLPHKFKVGLALPEDNCVDVYAQDVGLLAIREGGRIAGYEAIVGGGMGMIPSAAASFPALAQPMAFVPPEDVLELILAIMTVYRDIGNRTSRSKARLKYLIGTLGLDEFRRRVEQQMGRPLAAPRGISVSGREDHLGWNAQDDGKWLMGVQVESGRLDDGHRGGVRSAVRDILIRFGADLWLTPQQNLLCEADASSRDEIDTILARHDVPLADTLSGVRRGAMSCPALPDCSNAITEAERIVPEVLAALEAEMERLGLADEHCAICVTGCPSGCARCYLADIALVGRTVDGKRAEDKFAIYVGGDRLGHRLNQLYLDLAPIDEVIAALKPLLAQYKQGRDPGESLGAFFDRKGVEQLRRFDRATATGQTNDEVETE